MKKHLILFVMMALGALAVSAQGLKNIEEYTLANGLTVILNEDHTSPDVFGYMVTKAGGKDDPSDATGMAHYMEHMMFKGTSKLGTTDYAKEKVHLDSIFMLYDELGKTTDESQRKEIQLKINQQSLKANEYAIPNELSNIIKQMGGTDMNANTSPDRTVYFNTFPPNQIEPWLDLYSHRFQDAIFRSFQSELEVVYEEKNMYADMFIMNMLEKFQYNFFKSHPYGQQTLIGTVDDLKNPSLTKMYQFYKTWYVPNNMALVLCGDFNAEQVKPMIEKAFGSWARRDVPQRKKWDEKPFNGRELVEVNMSPIKMGMLGFRTPASGDEEALILNVANRILSNEGQSGLLDQLTLNGDVLAAQLISMPYYDYGMTIAFVIPKILGQSLEEAEKLVLAKLEMLKKGEFDDWRIDAVKKELYRQHQLSMESNEYKGIQLGESFAQERPLSDVASYPERIKNITKEDVIRIANKYYGDNYLAFFSKMGSAKSPKIDKPGFKPVVSNTNAKSEFAKHLESIKTEEYTPKYIDFKNDISQKNLRQGINLYHAENPLNEVYTLKIRFHAGEEKLPMLKYAMQLMGVAATPDMTSAQLKDEFAKIGTTYSFSANDSYTTIELTGLENQLAAALKLINGVMNHPVIAQKELKLILEAEKANRKVERSEPESLADALFQWVKYGEQSSLINRLTMKQIAALNTDSLAAEFLKATQFEAEIHYVGQKNIDEVGALISQNLTFNSNLKFNEAPVEKAIRQYDENTVFVVNKKKALQSKIFFMANGDKINLNQVPSVEAFNLYFGGDFSGIVLQEIREYRSLAYGAGANYRMATLPQNQATFYGFIGTQADKTGEALDVFMDLSRNLPVKKERMDFIRPYLEQSSITSKPGFRSLSTHILALQKKGYTQDPALMYKEQYRALTFDNIANFHAQYLKNKPFVIAIAGDMKRIDPKELAKYGKVVVVKEKSLFSK